LGPRVCQGEGPFVFIKVAPMLQQAQLANGKLLRGETAAANVFVYVNPEESERKYLSGTLQLDEHTLASALDPDELARVEFDLNAISSNARLIERLKNNAAKIGFTPENTELIDDLLIENSQCYEQALIYSNILASMMDARVSIVSNNLNWLMKTLTIITIAIQLPTLVVSIFSMNVSFPGKEWPWMFWAIVAAATLSVASLRIVWLWKKW
jgi:magnesium transporter